MGYIITSYANRLAAVSLVALVLGGVSACRDRPLEANNPEAAHHDEHDHETEEHAHDEHDHETEEAGHDEHDHEISLSDKAMKQYGIQIGLVRRQILLPTFTAPARISFNTEALAHVGAPVAGRVSELKVKVGDFVEKGAVLLVVQSPELGEAQSEYFQKALAAKAAAPPVALAQNAYERARSLHEQTRGIALNEVQRRQAEYKAAQAALQAMEAAVTSAESKLRLLGMDETAFQTLATTNQMNPFYEIHAPISGQVIEREVTLGELVDPDQEALLVLVDKSILWILADVPEARIKNVTVGAKVRVIPAVGDGEIYEGEVSFISPAINPSTRTAEVRIEINNTSSRLRPGMFAQAEITIPNAAGNRPILVIPDGATQTVEGRPTVFIPLKEEKNTFAVRPVSVGKAVSGLVPVYSGLNEGEAIVTAGSFILKAELGKSSAKHVH